MEYYKQGPLSQAIQKQKTKLANSTTCYFVQLQNRHDFKELFYEHVGDYRERIFSPLKTLHLFLRQTLNADQSCQNIVFESNLEVVIFHVYRQMNLVFRIMI